MTVVYQDLACAGEKELDRTSEGELGNVGEKGILDNKLEPLRLL